MAMKHCASGNVRFVTAMAKRKGGYKECSEVPSAGAQAASNISSSGKVQECLVLRQGLGRTQILLEIRMLIFDWRCAVVKNQDARWRTLDFAVLGLEAPASSQSVIRAAHATCSGGLASSTIVQQTS